MTYRGVIGAVAARTELSYFDVEDVIYSFFAVAIGERSLQGGGNVIGRGHGKGKGKGKGSGFEAAVSRQHKPDTPSGQYICPWR